MQALEKEFVVVGGIKERMYSARTGYRKNQDNKIREMESIISEQKEIISKLHESNTQLQTKYEELKTRAVNAYYSFKKQLKEDK